MPFANWVCFFSQAVLNAVVSDLVLSNSDLRPLAGFGFVFSNKVIATNPHK